MTTQRGNVFIPNNTAGSRRETAVLLVGTADEQGIDQQDIHAVPGGFFIGDDLADILYSEGVVEEGGDEDEVSDTFDPRDHNIDGVKDFVGANPEQAQAVLDSERDGENRTTLVKWLSDFIETQASGDPAAKNDSNTSEE